MRKSVIIICLILICFPISVKAEQTDGSSLFAKNAAGAYVMEYTTMKEVFKKEETKKLYPASMTKMMSLLLVYEALEAHVIAYDDIITTSAYAASMGGSQIFLEENEMMSVKDLLKSVCIASANDAIVALAEKVAGNESSFVEKMNQKAKQIGCINTHFVNTTGLHDENHYSCAKDMAIIAKHLLDIGGNELLAITSTYEDYIREDSDKKFWLVNTNKLIRQYEGCDGLKTGYTSEAGSCITVSAKRNHMRFIVVVMKEPDAKTRNAEVAELLDYSFSLFDQMMIYSKGKKIETRKIPQSKEGKVDLICEEDISIIYEKGKEVAIASQEVKWLDKKLPYKENQRIAQLKIELNDGTKITSYLISKKKVTPLSFVDVFIKGMLEMI